MNTSVPRVLVYADELRNYLASQLREKGTVTPMAIVLGRVGGPDGRAAILEPDLSNGFSPGMRDAFAETIRSMARTGDAYAVFFLMEIWIATKRKPERKSYREWADEHASKSIAGQPESREALWLQLEHEDLFAPAVWVGAFERDSKGRPLPPQFSQMTDGTVASPGLTTFESRFTGLLGKVPRGGVDA